MEENLKLTDTKHPLFKYAAFATRIQIANRDDDSETSTRYDRELQDIQESEEDRSFPALTENAIILRLIIIKAGIRSFYRQFGISSDEEARLICLDLEGFRKFIEKRKSPDRSGYTWGPSYHEYSRTAIEHILPFRGKGIEVDDDYGVTITRYRTDIPGIFYEERVYDAIGNRGFEREDLPSQYHYLPDEE